MHQCERLKICGGSLQVADDPIGRRRMDNLGSRTIVYRGLYLPAVLKQPLSSLFSLN